MLGEIDDDVPVLRAEHRMREIDREVELEAVVRIEARPLVAVAHFDGRRARAGSAWRAACSTMPADCSRNTNGPALPSMIGSSGPATSTCRLSMPSPASADIRCSTVEIDAPSACERRRQPRVADVRRVRGNRRPARGRSMRWNTMPGVGGRRTQRELDPRAGVQADAGRANRRLQRALPQHGFESEGGARRTGSVAARDSRSVILTLRVPHPRPALRASADRACTHRARSVGLLAQERRNVRRIERRRRRRSSRWRPRRTTAGWSSLS